MIISEEIVLTQTLTLLRPPIIFGKIPKCFDTAVLIFLSFCVLVLNPISHMYIMLCYSIVIILSTIWVTHDEIWSIRKVTASFT